MLRQMFVSKGEHDDQAIELAFSKKKIEERKQWLAGFEPGTYLDQSVDEISYSDFVNKVRPPIAEVGQRHALQMLHVMNICNDDEMKSDWDCYNKDPTAPHGENYFLKGHLDFLNPVKVVAFHWFPAALCMCAPQELILFSRADLERSIPNMVDGLKPGQRKILFCCFKRNIKKDVKVGKHRRHAALSLCFMHKPKWAMQGVRNFTSHAHLTCLANDANEMLHATNACCSVVQQVAQLSGFVSADTAYHHGEASLQSTIIGLAHNFIGSNNVNLLVPQGAQVVPALHEACRSICEV